MDSEIDKQVLKALLQDSRGDSFQAYMQGMATEIGNLDKPRPYRENISDQFLQSSMNIVDMMDGDIEGFLAPETTRLACTNMLADGFVDDLCELVTVLRRSGNEHHIPAYVAHAESVTDLIASLPRLNGTGKPSYVVM